MGYESDRSYRVSTLVPNIDVKNETFMYNCLNDTWTESDKLFDASIIGPSDIQYSIYANRIFKERKNGNRLDNTDQNYNVTIVSVATDKL